MRLPNHFLSCTFSLKKIVVLCMMLSGCGGNNAAIWSAESKSPNGNLVAQAYTLQSSGLGTSAVATGVYLKRAASSLPPTQVLGFSNNSAYPLGITGVKMKWITNSHLDVAYNAGATLNFQIAKADGVEITAHQAEPE